MIQSFSGHWIKAELRLQKGNLIMPRKCGGIPCQASSMNLISHKLLKPTSVLVFVVAMVFFLHELMFIHPARRLSVTDKDHQVIGEVYVPHDSNNLKIFGFLVVVSGLQMWVFLSVTKKNDAHDA
jgi:hypothetical protein